MTTMRDSKGEEYELHLFDREGIMLDPNRLIDGDWLKDPRVYRTAHEAIIDKWSNMRSFPPVIQSTLAGRCLSCNLIGPFYVNDGKEYCGLCNEFFDTYALRKKPANPVDVLRHKLKIIHKKRDDARRKGDFVLTHQLENEIGYLETQFSIAVEKEAQDYANINLHNNSIRDALSNNTPDSNAPYF